MQVTLARRFVVFVQWKACRLRWREPIRVARLACGWLVLVLLAASCPVTPPARAQAEIDPRKEYNVKGAFLYSFGRYVTWPADVWQGPSEPFVIGVLGESRIAPVLAQIEAAKVIQGRRIEIREATAPAETYGCHMLFIPRSQPADVQREVIALHRDSHVLLVGESAHFAQWGGNVNFYLDEGAVRFEINVESVRHHGLILDAKLLRIARPVSVASVAAE